MYLDSRPQNDGPLIGEGHWVIPQGRASAPLLTVVTKRTISASAAEVWERLVFYEQIDDKPPFLLRLLLPVPIRTQGQITQPGDELACMYETGKLVKRITRIEPGRLYEFDVVEQALSFGRGIQLSGGSYALRELSDGQTQIAVETRYRSARLPRWLWRPLEQAICHAFHRYLLRSMRHAAKSA